jgi:YidC/Oxa1 family membrane protein insertase
MDKRTILAFLLIGLILIVTQTKFYKKYVLPEQSRRISDSLVVTERAKSDSVSLASREFDTSKIVPKAEQKAHTPKQQDAFGLLFPTTTETSYAPVEIITDNFVAKINPKGAVISSWILKRYRFKDEELVQLIDKEGDGNLGIFFTNNEDTVYTYNSFFKPDKNKIEFEEGQLTDSVRFTLDLENNRQLVKTYKFYKDQYLFEINIEIKNLLSQFDKSQYFLSWKSGLSYTELDYSNYIDKEDINNAKAYVYQGGSKEDLSLPNKPFEAKARSDFSGVVDWAAIRTKYFAMIILPEPDLDIEPTISGKTLPIYNDIKLKDRVYKEYSIALKSIIDPAKQNFVKQSYRVYLGPLDYYVIREYHPTLAKIMDFGMTIIQPFAKFVLMAFIFLHSLIPNYGIVLILFAILIKILTYPLTKKSTASMQRMQTLQPKMTELKEKHAKDPQRLNKETMKLYKEEGINPLSGCLPTLLQLPLLWAIFIVFRNTIELRDAAFVWWIKDLSIPDTIMQLPFSIPFYGDLVNILPLVMGASMFIQQKMTMKDPKQKAMVYFMPIFLTLLFNSFPSGLNLYYSLFNIFQIIQQKWMPVKESSHESKEIKKTGDSIKSKKDYYRRK